MIDIKDSYLHSLIIKSIKSRVREFYALKLYEELKKHGVVYSYGYSDYDITICVGKDDKNLLKHILENYEGLEIKISYAEHFKIKIKEFYYAH